MNHLSAEQFEAALKQPYAWPGGYAVHFIMADGEWLCFECATKERERILMEIADPCDNGWLPIYTEINWEDPSAYCCHCNKPVAPEYCDHDTVAARATQSAANDDSVS